VVGAVTTSRLFQDVGRAEAWKTLPDDTSSSKSKQEEGSNPKMIGAEIDLFVKQIDSLADILPLATTAIDAVFSSAADQFSSLVKKDTVRTGDQKKFILEPGKYLQYLRLAGRIQKASLAQRLIPNSFLVSLVSQFDAFLGCLIRRVRNLNRAKGRFTVPHSRAAQNPFNTPTVQPLVFNTVSSHFNRA
jgi:hypothetical protein